MSQNTAMVPPEELRQLQALHEAGRYVQLEQHARALAARYPLHPVVWKALGIALRMQSKDPLPALEKSVQLAPRDPEAHSNLGIALLERGRVADALARFQQALAIKPDFAEVHNLLGNVLLDHGQAEKAATCYRNAITIRPDYVDAHNNLGNALLRLERLDDAATSYRRALQLRPDYAEVHNNLGNALMDRGRTEEAIASFRRAIELKPRLAEAQGSLGTAYFEAGRLEDALASFQSALALKPTDAKLHNGLGNVLLHLRRPADAAESCRRAVALKSDFDLAQANLGMALLDLGRFDEAAVHFQRALEITPRSAEVHNNLGHVWRNLARYEDAISSYRTALAIKPDYAEAHNNLGVALRLLGRTAEAEASCRRALELNPNLPIALATLADAHADRGEFSEAETLFRRALALQPDVVEAWTGIARVRRMTLDDTEWRDTVQRLLQQPLRPREAVSLHYSLGKYFDDVRQYDQAFEHYRRANELKREFSHRYDALSLTEAIDELIRVFSRDWYEQARAGGVPSSRPVFVIGMPRSGTSLVEQILASHPHVFGAGELTFWLEESNKYLDRVRRNAPVEGLIGRFAREYLQRLQGLSADAQRVIDKMPGNFMYLGPIRAALPDARIIHLRRDPVDTCLSIYFQDFGDVLTYANDLDDLAHYYGQYRRIMQHWQSILPPGALLEVPYEALVAEQESWSRRMLDFIDLPWDPRCLDFHRTARNVLTTSRWQVRQKISTASVARWRNYAQHVAPLQRLVEEPQDG